MIQLLFTFLYTAYSTPLDRARPTLLSSAFVICGRCCKDYVWTVETIINVGWLSDAVLQFTADSALAAKFGVTATVNRCCYADDDIITYRMLMKRDYMYPHTTLFKREFYSNNSFHI